jgi:hypothetical protein
MNLTEHKKVFLIFQWKGRYASVTRLSPVAGRTSKFFLNKIFKYFFFKNFLPKESVKFLLRPNYS